MAALDVGEELAPFHGSLPTPLTQSCSRHILVEGAVASCPGRARVAGTGTWGAARGADCPFALCDPAQHVPVCPASRPSLGQRVRPSRPGSRTGLAQLNPWGQAGGFCRVCRDPQPSSRVQTGTCSPEGSALISHSPTWSRNDVPGIHDSFLLLPC